jgi:hypothetical protein
MVISTVRRKKFKRQHTTNEYGILAEKCITAGKK